MADPPVVCFGLSLAGAPSPDGFPSPVTELTQCFTGLSAFQTGDTPCRRLDLSNISDESVDAAVLLTSPKSEDNADQPVSLPVSKDSPAVRMRRLKQFRPFLPRLMCSSPKRQLDRRAQQEPLKSNKENVARWGQHHRGEDASQAPGCAEPFALGSPISPAPAPLPADFLGDREASDFMEAFAEQEESSVAVGMSSSMAQLLSDPLMNQEVDFSSVSVSRQGGRHLFRSPSMPLRLHRAVLKRPPESPASNVPLKRHRTLPGFTEDEKDAQGRDQASADRKSRRCLLKKTLSLCEVAHHLGGDNVNAEFIGDFSKVFALPTVTGRHQDLKYITVETMCALLNGEFSSLVESFVVVDCRYPYEYQGGHIKGALNLPNSDEAVEHLLRQRLRPRCPDKRLVLVFHCEFSSERAPRTCRLLRRDDRSINEYPALCYPELYILKGGYKDFFHASKEHCEPQAYCPMHHEDHRDQLLQFRSHSRASAEERRRRQQATRLIKL
ncbi:M-phase inducer phosphatase 1-B-like isoform X2 [Brienomyrus brachyistius]|nr:M-phase inducer phosphatase 1-B-like isoform X2 [Brienomyrus brachyistius]